MSNNENGGGSGEFIGSPEGNPTLIREQLREALTKTNSPVLASLSNEIESSLSEGDEDEINQMLQEMLGSITAINQFVNELLDTDTAFITEMEPIARKEQLFFDKVDEGLMMKPESYKGGYELKIETSNKIAHTIDELLSLLSKPDLTINALAEGANGIFIKLNEVAKVFRERVEKLGSLKKDMKNYEKKRADMADRTKAPDHVVRLLLQKEREDRTRSELAMDKNDEYTPLDEAIARQNIITFFKQCDAFVHVAGNEVGSLSEAVKYLQESGEEKFKLKNRLYILDKTNILLSMLSVFAKGMNLTENSFSKG